MNEILNDANFMLYAAKHYDNAQCADTIEFYDDLKRFKYLKRLFNRYVETGELKERLILNHLIVLYNVFGVVPATRMLFLKLKDHYSVLKPFLVFLGYMPDKVVHIGLPPYDVISSEIVMNEDIIKTLRKL